MTSERHSSSLQFAVQSAGKYPQASPSGTPCEITMVYHGPHLQVDFDRLVFYPVDEVLVSQQHCGGENRVVFKKMLRHGGTLRRRRVKSRPFAFLFVS
jgi:hypothetical protein